MQAVAEQLGQRNDQELSPVLRVVEHRNDISSLRQQIGIIADDSYRSNYMSEVSYRWHKDVTRPDNTDPRVTTELLEGIKGFAQKQKNYGRVIHSHLQKAARDRVASEGDVKFLLEAFAHHPDFVSKFVEAERDILNKIDRMKDDRKAYDQLVHHPLVKNTGFLKTESNIKIDIPNEKAFLKMTVPERREFLEKAKNALPLAEKYAESHESEEAIALEKEYNSLLRHARGKKILGKASIEKYIDGFRNIDLEEKKNWIKEMKNGHQLERYEILWKNIRKTLKGKGLERMETFREKRGYSELLEAFGEEKEFESQRNVFAYKTKLDTALQQKLISRHTHKAFLGDIRDQTLESQQEYLNQFDEQMERYQILRTNIDGMKSKEARSVLDEMYESADFGYREISAKYDRLKSQEGSSIKTATSNSKAELALAQIQNDTIKGAARSAKEELDLGEKKAFVERISSFFNGKGAGQQDVSSYQKNVKRARRKMTQQEVISEEESAPLRESDNITSDTLKVDDSSLEESLEGSENLRSKKEFKKQKGKKPLMRIKTNQVASYQQNTFSGEKGERRVTRVGIGSKKAVQAFNNEHHLHHDKDDLSLMAKEGNRIVELKVDEIRHFTDYLRHTIEEDQEAV